MEKDEKGKGAVSVRPVLKRNPDAPLYYSPVLDVRMTEKDIRLLSFIVPPADPEELEEKDGEYLLPIRSQAEYLIPMETVGPLIQILQTQYNAYLERKKG